MAFSKKYHALKKMLPKEMFSFAWQPGQLLLASPGIIEQPEKKE